MSPADAARQTLARPFIQIVSGAAVLAAPVVFNGLPFLFPDTGTYLGAGYRALRALLLLPATPHITDTFMAARSPFYGAPLHVAVSAGTIWAVLALQALAASFTLRLIAKIVCPDRPGRSFLALIGVLTFFSALPLFAGFATPDVFAGIALALAICLLFYSARLTKRERLWAGALFVASLVFHASHLLTALVFVPLCAFALWRTGRGLSAARTGAILLGIAVLLLGGGAALNAFSPTPQHAPPFITARMLADGPGRHYLRAACARDEQTYALCAFRDQPLADSEDILWSGDVATGVFTLADLPTRLRLIEEQPRFVIGVLTHQPAAQAWASLRNAATQFAALGLDPAFAFDGRYWLGMPENFVLRRSVERVDGCPDGAEACRSRLPLNAMTQIHMFVVLMGGFYLAGALLARRAPVFSLTGQDAEDWGLFAIVLGCLLAGLAANALICGAISGPFPRYQARLAWLVPAFAILAELRFPLLRRVFADAPAGRLRLR